MIVEGRKLMWFVFAGMDWDKQDQLDCAIGSISKEQENTFAIWS